MVETTVLFQRLGISLLLGLLVGLQREYTESGMPGLRTFPLITVLGSVAAILAAEFGGWIVAAELLGLVVVLAFPNIVRIRGRDPDPGITTDVAVLLMYGVGALVVVGPVPVAVVVGGGVAVLLHFKLEMHRFAKRLGDADLRAIMQFALITCIILPILPDERYGPPPLNVFNPFETWLLVVFIVGMSLGGYIAYKFLGRDAGILLGGVLGGLVSSTATTLSYARQARNEPRLLQPAAVVIMIASTVVFVRVLVEVAVAARSILVQTLVPAVIVMALMAIPALLVWRGVRREHGELPEQGNPTEMKSAVLFAGLYLLVLLALAAAKEYIGQGALYPVAILSGLTDMDAITLSTGRMAESGNLAGEQAWRLILTAFLANLVFKAGLAGLLGSRQLLWHIALLFSIPFAGGVLLILFWPW